MKPNITVWEIDQAPPPGCKPVVEGNTIVWKKKQIPWWRVAIAFFAYAGVMVWLAQSNTPFWVVMLTTMSLLAITFLIAVIAIFKN